MKDSGYLSSFLVTIWLWLRGFLRPKRILPTSPERILILGYAAIGDLIFFLPVIEALRRRYPRAKITFIANKYATTEEILPATGVIDEIWLSDCEGEEAELEKTQINRRIHEAGFDLVLLSLPSPAHYFQWGLRDIPIRAGHCRILEAPHESWSGLCYLWLRLRRGLIMGEWARRVFLNRIAWVPCEPEHVLKTNMRLLEALGLGQPAGLPKPALSILKRHREAAQEKLGSHQGKRRIGVHLGAPNNQYGKMWDPGCFAELCKCLSEKVAAQFVLIGGGGEEQSAKVALAAFPGMISLVGRCSLLETFAVIETCDLLLANDTGLAKAAIVLGVPTATWWGPSDPREYGVAWESEKHLDIRTRIWCSPCSRMGMPKEGPGILNYTNCGHHDCLKKLTVDFALKAILDKYASLLGVQGV